MTSQMKSHVTIGTVITLLAMAVSLVATYFQGMASSKEYTDAKVAKSQEATEDKIDKIQSDMNKMRVDVEVVKQILVQRFGTPN